MLVLFTIKAFQEVVHLYVIITTASEVDLVLSVLALVDMALYHLVPDVTICYRCLSQYRGAGSSPPGRFHPFDVVKSVIDSLGALGFWKVRMRPGKPLAFGNVQGIPFLGLPGNPVAVMVTFLAFVRPALLAIAAAGPKV